MRDIEFLPTWYVKTRLQRRLLRLQIIILVLVATALGTWILIKSEVVAASEQHLTRRKIALDVSESRVKERQTLERLRQQLQTQERVDASLGLNVESARVLELIDQCLPARSSLIDITLKTQEKPISTPTIAGQTRVDASAAKQMSRSLEVAIKGVSPSPDDVAALLENLEKSGVCRSISLDKFADRVENGHVMREFLVTFLIPLDMEKGAK